MIILPNKFAHNSHAHCDQIRGHWAKIKKCSSVVNRVKLPIKTQNTWNAQMIGLSFCMNWWLLSGLLREQVSWFRGSSYKINLLINLNSKHQWEMCQMWFKKTFRLTKSKMLLHVVFLTFLVNSCFANVLDLPTGFVDNDKDNDMVC